MRASLQRRRGGWRCRGLGCRRRVWGLRLGVVGLSDNAGYELALTQAELAECLGLTSVHVNRTLKELRERGLSPAMLDRLALDAGRLSGIADAVAAVAALPGIRKGGVAVFPASDPRHATERLVVLAETRTTDAARRAQLLRDITALSATLLGAPADDVVLAPPHSVRSCMPRAYDATSAASVVASGT